MPLVTEIVGVVGSVDVLFLDTVLDECRLVRRLVHKPEARVANLVMRGLEEINASGREPICAVTKLWGHVCFRF